MSNRQDEKFYSKLHNLLKKVTQISHDVENIFYTATLHAKQGNLSHMNSLVSPYNDLPSLPFLREAFIYWIYRNTPLIYHRTNNKLTFGRHKSFNISVDTTSDTIKVAERLPDILNFQIFKPTDLVEFFDLDDEFEKFYWSNFDILFDLLLSTPSDIDNLHDCSPRDLYVRLLEHVLSNPPAPQGSNSPQTLLASLSSTSFTAIPTDGFIRYRQKLWLECKKQGIPADKRYNQYKRRIQRK